MQRERLKAKVLIVSILAVSVAALSTASNIVAADPNANSVAPSEQAPSSQLTGGWHFVRTRNPHGTDEVVSIMHTADISRSDPDLAGLTIRCAKRGTEILIVLIRSFPLRARPTVVLGPANQESRFKTTVASPGTAILLPEGAATLVRSWFTQNALFIRVADDQNTIQGVVPLEGLETAFKVLIANCR
jgi:hypothetical protein